MEVVKYFIINLEHREDRRIIAEKYMKAAGIENYEFFKAVHHKEFTEEFIQDMVYGRKYTHRVKSEVAKRASLGCGTSHLRLMKKILEEYGDDGTKAFVILEDDFHLHDETTFVQKINEGLEIVPKDWEMIYLGDMGKEHTDRTEKFLPGIDKANNVWGTHGYIMRNYFPFVHKFERLYEDGYLADRAFRKMVRDDKKNLHKYLIFRPYLAVQWQSYSDIDEKMFTHSNFKHKFTEN